MHKRVLLVDQSDTVRNVAETVLRQNGFEVISLSSPDKALEVVGLSRPELMIIGADLHYKDQRPFYEKLQADQATRSIPLLVVAQRDQQALNLPEEVVMRVPFDPQEFLDRVRLFTGGSSQATAAGAPNPLAGAAVEDDLLDAALGLDQIEVESSEVMDKTSITGRHGISKVPQESFHVDKTDPAMKDSGRVESIMIRDDQTDIVQKTTGSSSKADLSASQKLEILDEADQYNMSASANLAPDPVDQVHDYSWFVSEMQIDSKKPQAAAKAAPAPADPDDSGSLHVDDPSLVLEPVRASGVQPNSRQDGVGKFIDEFKKEVEKFQEGEPESILVQSDSKTGSEAPAESKWEETLEKLTPDDVTAFIQHFSRELAHRVADLIVAKIDPEKLMRLMAREAGRAKSDDK